MIMNYKENNKSEFSWHEKEYQRLATITEELEISFPKDFTNKEIFDTYTDRLFRASTLLCHFSMMAFLDDFGKESHKFHDLSNNLISKVEGLMKRIYN